MSLLYIKRIETPSLYTGRSVSHLYREERKTPSLYTGKSVSLLYVEEADESVSSLDIEERVSFLYMERTETHTREGVSLFFVERMLTSFLENGDGVLLYIERREVSSRYEGRNVSLLSREEIDSFFIKMRECLALY